MLRHTILVDQVVYPFVLREDIIELLQDHIKSNIVKVRRICLQSRHFTHSS